MSVIWLLARTADSILTRTSLATSGGARSVQAGELIGGPDLRAPSAPETPRGVVRAIVFGNMSTNSRGATMNGAMTGDGDSIPNDVGGPSDEARWADERIQEIWDSISDLDNTPLNEVTTLFYMHGYNELELAVRDLLMIIDGKRDGS